MAHFIHEDSITDLGTVTVIVPSTDKYAIRGTLTLPNIVPPPTPGTGGGAGTGSGDGKQISSQVVVTIRQNGTIIFTSNPGDRGFSLLSVQCTAADSISIQRSSSLAQDQQPAAVKMTYSIEEGLS